MNTYNVLVMRPDWFMYEVEDYDNLSDLQYFATGIKAKSQAEAAKAACKEACAADRKGLKKLDCWNRPQDHDLRELEPGDYIVIGFVAEITDYEPCFNQPR